MSRYIDAEKINLNYLPLTALGGQMFAYAKDIDETPTEDVAPIKHGKWVDWCNDGDWHCSNCCAIVEKEEQSSHNWYYCYHCGARMDG